MTSGEYLKNLREHKGLTQADLAELVGVSRTSIQNYESDEQSPRRKTVKKLAKALDRNEVELFTVFGYPSTAEPDPLTPIERVRFEREWNSETRLGLEKRVSELEAEVLNWKRKELEAQRTILDLRTKISELERAALRATLEVRDLTGPAYICRNLLREQPSRVRVATPEGVVEIPKQGLLDYALLVVDRHHGGGRRDILEFGEILEVILKSAECDQLGFPVTEGDLEKIYEDNLMYKIIRVASSMNLNLPDHLAWKAVEHFKGVKGDFSARDLASFAEAEIRNTTADGSTPADASHSDDDLTSDDPPDFAPPKRASGKNIPGAFQRRRDSKEAKREPGSGAS